MNNIFCVWYRPILLLNFNASEATLSRTGMNIDLVRYETTETDNMTQKKTSTAKWLAYLMGLYVHDIVDRFTLVRLQGNIRRGHRKASNPYPPSIRG